MECVNAVVIGKNDVDAVCWSLSDNVMELVEESITSSSSTSVGHKQLSLW